MLTEHGVSLGAKLGQAIAPELADMDSQSPTLGFECCDTQAPEVAELATEVQMRLGLDGLFSSSLSICA